MKLLLWVFTFGGTGEGFRILSTIATNKTLRCTQQTFQLFVYYGGGAFASLCEGSTRVTRPNHRYLNTISYKTSVASRVGFGGETSCDFSIIRGFFCSIFGLLSLMKELWGDV